ncbi:calcium-transporting ATPase 1 [bacterium BMS3Bbin01]|nr:calcium-transporting ATPase 1 [bacterium BMS3Bbin01]
MHVKRPIVLCCGNLALTELPSTTTNLRHRMDARTTADWHAISVTEAVARLDTNERDGLGHAEAGARLEQHGANRIREVPAARRYQVLARQFTDVLIIILLIAAAVSFAVGEIADAVTILVIVVLNGALGFVQEWKAEQALEALRSMLSPTCSVTRAGQPMEIDRIDLVPGDLVTLEIGDQVPADLRLVESLNLKVDESALTGESGSVHKDTGPVPGDTQLAQRTPMVWMGTNVTNGRALGVVVATGMATVFGKIAELTQSLGQEPTPLQRKLAVLGKQLGVISIAISAAVALVGVLLGKPLLEMFLTGVSLAVAVVPEGLPAVVTITLALGIRAMVRRHALLRRLQAAEALGSATVICTDKTGTLTKNEMTVTRIWMPAGPVQVTGVGYDPKGHFTVDGQKLDHRTRPDLLALLETGLLCNHARVTKTETGWRQVGEPTEAALVVAAYKAWQASDDGDAGVTEFSFNSARKRMTVVARRPEGLIAFTKGAPEVILSRATRILEGTTERNLTDDDRTTFEDAYRSLAGQGLRTLALARRVLPTNIELDEDKIESDLTLLGVVGIIDPPRPEVPAAIALAREAGVRPIMITGDAPETAIAIGRNVGMHVERAVTGGELDTMDDGALDELLTHDILFARTTPEHKLRIVAHLQAQGNIVAMTGDGVNDAPALKKADIGIAMGLRGTDVAKAASDMVLTDDNFASIVGAVEEGRRQYDNIQKFVRYLLSSNTGEVVAVFVNILLKGPLILLPVQILWMNLVTDGMTAVALGLEPGSKDLMEQPPRGAREPILNKTGAALLLGLGGYIGVGTLWLFHHYLATLGRSPEAIATAQTVAFTGIILLEKMNVFNFRSLRRPLHRIGFWTNPWVLGAWVITVGSQVAAVYVPFLQKVLHTVPLRWEDWLLMLAVAIPIFLVVEAIKILRTQGSQLRSAHP